MHVVYPLPGILLLLLAVASATGTPAAQATSSGFRLATFQCDATPPLGEPMIWDVPLVRVVDPLLAKGLILEGGGHRYVLITLDWCELCNDAELSLRRTLADAVGTSADRVAIHVVHQHAAPYADVRAHKYLDECSQPVPHLSDRFLKALAGRLAAAAHEAMDRLTEFDSIGAGQARVDRVASARRLKSPDGSITVRYSGSGKDPAMAAAPEGEIDPWLKTVTLARGSRPLARLHFYATHPQTFACDGRASADFAGAAREALQREENVFQVYLTGCAGDVTVGKYNDGSDAARDALAHRLAAGMRNAIAATRAEPLQHFAWRCVDLTLPLRREEDFGRSALLQRIQDPAGLPGTRIYLGAMRLAFLDRHDRPLLVRCLEMGNISILQLPGEPMLEFQRFAQAMRADRFVAVAGYFDTGPGYLCTDRAYDEGGYEPGASHVAAGSEARLKQAIRKALSATAGGASEGGSR